MKAVCNCDRAQITVPEELSAEAPDPAYINNPAVVLETVNHISNYSIAMPSEQAHHVQTPTWPLTEASNRQGKKEWLSRVPVSSKNELYAMSIKMLRESKNASLCIRL